MDRIILAAAEKTPEGFDIPWGWVAVAAAAFVAIAASWTWFGSRRPISPREQAEADRQALIEERARRRAVALCDAEEAKAAAKRSINRQPKLL